MITKKNIEAAVTAVREEIGTIAKTMEVYEVVRHHGFTYKSMKETLLQPRFAEGRGKWNIDAMQVLATEDAPVPVVPVRTPSVATTEAPTAKVAQSGVSSYKTEDCFIPTVLPEYVKWGEYSNLEKIIKSGMFFPVWIAGLSGNGKTIMVEQCCAKLKVPYIRVQITPETDEDDLIGGFRLVDGETVFCKGPVIKAMEDGAILLIDEIDRGTNKIMCLQGVLEGSPVLIKKTGEMVMPSAGFNVVATANTLGRGSEDGRFAAASILDDAFLERFVSVINQGWPTKCVEKRIVTNHMKKFTETADVDFAEKLCSWANIIRRTFEADGVDEVISTRRLCHIAKSHAIFNDRLQAIKMCINRFDDETEQAFLDVYSKVDAGELTDQSEEQDDDILNL